MSRWLTGTFALFVLLMLLVAALHPSLPPSLDAPLSRLNPNLINISIPLQSIAEGLWSRIIVPLAVFASTFPSLIFSWPVAAIVIAYMVLSSGLLHHLLPEFARRLKTLELFGISFELPSQISELRRETHDLVRLIPSVQGSIAEKIRQNVAEMNLEDAAQKVVLSVMSEIKEKISDKDPNNYRATFHIQDILFAGRLLQLFDYFGHDGNRLPGRGAGRTFSVRRGIIGRVWRSGLSEISGVLPNEEAPAPKWEGADNRHLIARIWGLTMDEVDQVKKYPSYLCVYFEYGKNQRAVFYVDSTEENAFPKNDECEIIQLVRSKIRQARLDSALGELQSALSEFSPRLEIFEKSASK